MGYVVLSLSERQSSVLPHDLVCHSSEGICLGSKLSLAGPAVWNLNPDFKIHLSPPLLSFNTCWQLFKKCFSELDEICNSMLFRCQHVVSHLAESAPCTDHRCGCTHFALPPCGALRTMSRNCTEYYKRLPISEIIPSVTKMAILGTACRYLTVPILCRYLTYA